ncbi:MAG: hypothetical protein AAFZ63_23570 [Bacteroidota bacterium]
MRIIILLSLLLALCSCENKYQRTTAPLDPVAFEALFADALIYLDNGEMAEAKERFLQLEKMDPSSTGVKMNLSVIANDDGDKQQAIKYAEEAFELAPNNVAIARYLEQLTGNEVYAAIAYELQNRVLKVDAETYFLNFKKESPVVNSDYANFDIKITGVVTAKDSERNILFLYGEGTAPGQGVQCWSLPNDVFANAGIGDTLSFIGFSYGQGADLSDPVIAFKRLE